MKKKYSSQFKLIILLSAILLALATAMFVRQVLNRHKENLNFVFNPECTDFANEVNISDILYEF